MLKCIKYSESIMLMNWKQWKPLCPHNSSFTNVKKGTFRNYVSVPNQGKTQASFQVVHVLAAAGKLSQTGK